jgi:Flp pilus assembly pilin Flp
MDIGGLIMNILKRFLRNEKGLEFIEWTILAALVVLGIVLVIQSLHGEIGNIFTGLEEEMVDAQAP